MVQSCREFDELWNDLLDRRGAPSPAIESALAAHAVSCDSCRDRAAGYEALRRHLSAWGSGESARSSPELTGRILDAWTSETVPATGSVIRLAPLAWAAAAAIVVAAGLGWLYRAERAGNAPGPMLAQSATTPARPLSESLASATAATLDLARETSAPAARLGRLMLASRGGTADTHEPPPTTTTDANASAMLESVGAGLRPISGSARKAFGFLLGPAAASPRPSSLSHPDA